MSRADLFPGFQPLAADIDGLRVAGRIGGSGPPLLLLHGYPQTHAMWHGVAPTLAARFTVVASDLRGYGASGKPPGGVGQAAYAKRAMAQDQVELMRSLGFERFAVAGHDRGGRVAHRLALDHPHRVTRVAVLDIVPTRTVFATVDAELARAYYHWFFLAQPDGFPERLIGADPGFYLDHTLRSWARAGFAFDPRALKEYVTAFADPETIRSSCDDYRAAAGIDLAHDAADAAPLTRPLLVMWGLRGAMHRIYDVPATWRALATDVTAIPVDTGHFLPEEAPDAVAAALADFFGDGNA